MRMRATLSRRSRFHAALPAAAAALVLALTSASWAGSGERHGRDDDRHGQELTSQERAIRLRERGDILPLAEIVRRSGLARRGRIIGVELEDEDDGPVYELKVLTDEGRVIEFHVDPATGRIQGEE